MENIIREERQTIRNSLPSQTYAMEKQTLKEKKHKQPSSPGGKLASFLNSLFNQTSLRKKKSKSTTTTQSVRGEDQESPGGRRKRRSSISNFRLDDGSYHNLEPYDTKSMNSSSISGFRTPPPYAHPPTKTCKNLRSYSDHRQVVMSLPKHNNGHVKSTTTLQNEVEDDKNNTDHAWLDEKFKFSDGFSEKHNNYGKGFLKKGRTWADQIETEEREFKKFFNEVDDGGDSDSSSDLFELQNYDSDHYSTGLPVYETTHMEIIKR
ncbi:unnamed protein product, partial [Ilex paraguariensis]